MKGGIRRLWPFRPASWLTAALFGRDLVSLAAVQHLRAAFVEGGDAERSDAH